MHNSKYKMIIHSVHEFLAQHTFKKQDDIAVQHVFLPKLSYFFTFSLRRTSHSQLMGKGGKTNVPPVKVQLHELQTVSPQLRACNFTKEKAGSRTCW